MAVLHIVQYSLPQIVSGYTIRTQAIARQQTALGLKPIVLTSPRHPGAADDEVEGIAYHRCPPERQRTSVYLRDAARVRALAAKIEQIVASHRDIRLLHAHSPQLCGMAALRAGRRLGLPVVYEVRGLWNEALRGRGPLPAWWLRYHMAESAETRVCRAAAAVVAVSEGLREAFIARGVAPGRIHVVGNGVDPQRFAPRDPASSWAVSHGLAGGQVVLYLGALRKYEGIHVLLEAFPLMLEARPDTRLVMVGDGEEQAQIAARALALGDRVHVLPAVPHAETPEWYAAADLIVYPRLSTRATELVTPLKPLEAMAMAKAIVASDVRGLRELLTDGETARLFPAGFVPGLAQACRELLADEGERARLGRAARDAVLARYDLRQVMAKYLGIYRQAGYR